MKRTIQRIVDAKKYHFSLFKTLYFNLKAFKFQEAIKLPVLLYGRTEIEGLHRGCVILSKVKTGCVKIGGGKYSEIFGHSCRYKNYLRIRGKLILGNGINIQQGVTISINKDAVVKIGDGVFFNENTTLHAKMKIYIGDKCWFGWKTQILDSDFHYLVNKGKLYYRNSPVYIGHNAWVANSVSILKGTRLPAYTVVASKSLVNKNFYDIGEGCLIGGIPAKFITKGVERLILRDSEVDKLFISPEDVLCWDDIKEELTKEKYHKQ